MLNFAVELQHQYENSTSVFQRKAKGQIFTPPDTARFMASLFSAIPETYNLLDPGAGLGILSAAFCEIVAELSQPRRITIDLFENDQILHPFLKNNLENCKSILQKQGHSLDYTIHNKDFVISNSFYSDSQSTLFEETPKLKFDGVIMNPPYFKIRKDSAHSKLMSHIVHGQPNIYAIFLALAANLLKTNGEIVAITPRSFCNGLYFRNFRRWYFQRVALDHIHIFKSRKDVFKQSSVLQENVITKVHKIGRQSPRVTISSSDDGNFSKNMDSVNFPMENIINDSLGDYAVRIPESSDDRKIIDLVESFSTRFDETGLRISTGPIVMFRTTKYLLYEADEKQSVPLLQSHNVKPFDTIWPLSKNKKPVAFNLCDKAQRFLLPSKNYILLKRFSTKEEKRRLNAGCYFKLQYPYSFVGVENHLNYIYHVDKELSENELYGIAALFNSFLLDRYFRTISGNTQVNATEIRTMPFPGLKTLSIIGRQVKHNTLNSESIVCNSLGICKTTEKCLADI